MMSQAGVIAALFVAAVVGLLGGCSSDGGANPSTGSQTTPKTLSDPSAPSRSAMAKANALVARPENDQDCGVLAADSGWPTTTVAPPSAGDCLLSALAEGRPATMIFTGRTGDGGALVTRYEVGAGRVVSVAIHTISSKGVTTTSTSRCRPTGGAWSQGVEGQLVDVESGKAFC